MKKIYASWINENIIEKLGEENRVHSVFKNGLNIKAAQGLIFIGSSRGLTPSGDDLLIGLLWINSLRSFLSQEFLSGLEELTSGEELTTDVSLDYYRSAFKGDYSSTLIALSQALIDKDEEKIIKSIGRVMEYGHSSGIDLLSGISIGLSIIIGGF